jgi:hypothetical protein
LPVNPFSFALSPLSSVFSVQLFFFGDRPVILPLLPLNLFSWLKDLFNRISCSAYTFFFDIKSLNDSTFFISRGGEDLNSTIRLCVGALRSCSYYFFSWISSSFIGYGTIFCRSSSFLIAGKSLSYLRIYSIIELVRGLALELNEIASGCEDFFT